MVSSSILMTILIVAAAAMPAAAQAGSVAAAPKPASASQAAQAPTPERAAELERLGLHADPGPDPDPTVVWIRNGRSYTINKIGREWTLPPRNGREGWLQPNHHVNMDAEIYQQNEDSVWFFIEVTPTDRPRPKFRHDSAGRKIKIMKRTDEQIANLYEMRGEFEPLSPKKSDLVLKLVDGSQGLPTSGSWRNSAAVADMNGDGNPDIITPPQRSAAKGYPWIFLGDGKGGWSVAAEVGWPERLFNYGSVSVGDLDRDGNLDLVFASHLEGIYAMLGDGKGGFRDANEGFPRDFATRRARLADVDRDGDLDIVAITEGPTPGSVAANRQDDVPLRLFLNDGKAKVWTQTSIAPQERQLAGDWMNLGDINGDKRLDVVGSSIIASGTDTIWLGAKKAVTFEPFGRGFLPWRSLYHANAVDRFSRRDRDDVVAAFFRTWPNDVDPDLLEYPKIEKVTGLERIWWNGKKFERTPILVAPSTGAIAALASGDVDGDGHLDIVYLDENRVELVLLLGDGKGAFTQARFDAPDLPVRRAYDLSLVDLDNDKRLDVLILYESDENLSNGAIKVLLNRGKVTNAT